MFGRDLRRTGWHACSTTRLVDVPKVELEGPATSGKKLTPSTGMWQSMSTSMAAARSLGLTAKSMATESVGVRDCVCELVASTEPTGCGYGTSMRRQHVHGMAADLF